MKKLMLLILVSLIILLAGCTTLNMVCEPDYVQLPRYLSSSACADQNLDLGECCKTSCFNNYQITSYKTEPITCEEILFGDPNRICVICKCDVNNCK